MMKKSGFSQGQLVPAPGSLLVVLSGPSGAGKDAVLARLKEQNLPLRFITTVTTRPKRNCEQDGKDYCFVSVAEFQRMIENDELIEHASVYGNLYGVPRQAVEQALGGEKDVILKLDIQGAATVRKIMPQSVLVFLAPARRDDLAARLGGRQTESASDLELRLKTADLEMDKLPMFDYLVVNHQGKIDDVVADIKAIIRAEKCRVAPCV
jgi:guanylate kinase